MPDSPLLICTRCCSLDIQGLQYPQEQDLLECRSCGHQMTYRVMREELELALRLAVLQIHLGVARKLGRGDAIAA
jgi:Zn ribbon nucleic-acid-binding protein